jgi:hypothetical protein
MREKREEETSVFRRGATATAGWSSFDGNGIRHKGHHLAPVPIELGQIDAGRGKWLRTTGPRGSVDQGTKGLVPIHPPSGRVERSEGRVER